MSFFKRAATSRPASICVLRHGYYPDDPTLVRELAALTNAGYEVDIICLRGAGQARTEVIGGVSVRRIPIGHRRGRVVQYFVRYGLSFVLMALTISWRYFVRRYECIQVNTMPDFLVFATLVPRLFGARILVHMHEPTPELFVTKFGEGRWPSMLRLQTFLEQQAIRYSHGLFAVNESIRERYINRGADGRKIRVMLNVPDESFLAAGPPPEPEARFTLATHGTLQPLYGYDVMLRALALLRDDIEALRLIMVGGGECADELKRLAAKLGLNDAVCFTGTVPFSKVAGVVGRAHVGLVSLLPTPFGRLCQPMKMFEYIALGRPVVAPRLEAIETIFDDSCLKFFEAGSATDMARAIRELYLDPSERRRLVENASRRYEQLRWKETKQNYLRVVESLVAGTKLAGSESSRP
jgi:glycosyltransferase involved in cell wall biosynthesis